MDFSRLKGATVQDLRLVTRTPWRAAQLRRQAARALGVISPGQIQSWPDFLAEWTPEVADASPIQLDRAISRAAAEISFPRFAQSGSTLGFRRAAAALIDEMTAAGVSARMLEQAGPLPPDLAGFQALYTRVEQTLAQWKVLLAGARARLAGEALGPGLLPKTILLEGFHPPGPDEGGLGASWSILTSGAEAVALRALQRFARVQILPAPGLPPRVTKIRASSPHEEAMEIARRIAEMHHAGRDISDFAIITGSAAQSLPLFRTALGRFQLQCHPQLDLPLSSVQPAQTMLTLVEALLSGWDRRLLLDLVRQPAAALLGTSAGDALEFQLRRAIPGAGLEGLRPLEPLQQLERWLSQPLTPTEWAARLGQLAHWGGATRQVSALVPSGGRDLAGQAEVIRTWRSTLQTVAGTMPHQPLPLAAFWAEMRDALPAATLRPTPGGVTVLDAAEAAACRAPVVFVCGLIEGVFPAFPPASPFLADDTRRELITRGLPLEPPEARALRQRQLARCATAAAEEELFVSWSSHQADGQERLPASLLQHLDAPLHVAAACRLEPVRPLSVPAAASLIDVSITAGKKWSPSKIERFAGCPFRYFGEETLGLKNRPDGPDERFGPLERGTLAHAVLRSQVEFPEGDLEAVFDSQFREMCRALHIPPSHRIEWERLELLRNLSAYLKTAQTRPGWTPHVEWGFEFDLVEGVTIRGRIDRFDEGPDGKVYAMDYKYSAAERVKQQAAQSVQGGLYLLALERAGYRPAGFEFIPLRGEPGAGQWADSPEAAMAFAREKTLEVVARVRSGEIYVQPLNRSDCAWCDFRDACRIQARGAAAVAVAEETE